MELKERFILARHNAGLSQAQLADKVGVSQAAINKIEVGKTLNPRNLKKFASVLSVTPEWLQYGTTAYDDADHNPTTHQSNAKLMGGIEPWGSKTTLPSDEVEIPFFTEVALAAGNGMIDIQENNGFKLRFAKSTLKRQGVEAEHAACVKVAGNSMEPVLPDGSTIGIDTAKTSIVDGKMFAIDHDGMLRVKVIYKLPGGGVRLKSFNTAEYPDEIYNKTDAQLIRIVGKVFWYSVLL